MYNSKSETGRDKYMMTKGIWDDKRIIGPLILCFLAGLYEVQLTKLIKESYEYPDKKSIRKKIISLTIFYNLIYPFADFRYSISYFF